MTAVPTAAEALWPGARVTRRPGRSGLLVLPGARCPRMLVPAGVPAARVMLKRHSTSRAQTVAQDVLAAGVRTGVLPLLPVARVVPGPGLSIETHVRAHVAGADRVGVLLGPPRANAKPVLQVFGADGRTLAFGKVGHDQSAGALVRRETEVLSDQRLRDLEHVDVPAVLSAEPYGALPVLLMEAMSASQSRGGSWELPLAATHEVAESAGVAWSPVVTSDYWADLTHRADQLADVGELRLVHLLTDVAPLVGGVSLGFGRWHGDWSPWNMVRSGSQMQVWDWEQSSVGVPLGFDAVHFLLQREFRAATPAREAARTLLAESSTALATWYRSADQVQATVLLYVAEISHRYLAQAATGATPQLTSRLALLEALAKELEPRSEPVRRTSSGWST